MQFGRRLLRQQVRGGDSSSYIRIVLLPYATDDWVNLFQRLSSKYGKYNKTYNQDKSFHMLAITIGLFNGLYPENKVKDMEYPNTSQNDPSHRNSMHHNKADRH